MENSKISSIILKFRFKINGYSSRKAYNKKGLEASICYLWFIINKNNFFSRTKQVYKLFI